MKCVSDADLFLIFFTFLTITWLIQTLIFYYMLEF